MTIAEARLTAKARGKIPKSKFAGPHNSFPVEDKAHFDAALSLAHYAHRPGSVRRRAIAIAKRDAIIPQDYKAVEGAAAAREASASDIAYDDIAQAIQRQMDKEHAEGDGDADDAYYEYSPCGQVAYVFPAYFIFSVGWGTCYFKRAYTIGDDMAATLGDVSTPVVRKITFLDAPEIAGEGMGESARDEEKPLWEAGSRHNADDTQHIADAAAHAGQAMQHMQHVQTHVTALGTSTPNMGSTYGAGVLPFLQSAREVGMRESQAGENVGIVEVAHNAALAFTEAAGKDAKGVISMTILRPGFNASRSRYYTKEAVASAHTKGTFAGKKMYLDHPTVREDKELPERSVGKIGAYITETALGPDGELVGKAVVVHPELKGMLAAMQEHGILDKAIGVSINATGKVREGEIEGRRTHIVEDFTHGRSVDFVTEPGAGGRIGLLESHSRPDAEPVTEGAPTVTPEQIQALMDEMKALREANATLTASVTESQAQASRATAIARTQGAVSARLAEYKDEDLPQIAKKRITLMFESAESADRLEEAITAEVEYVKSIKATGPKSGSVSGMGAKVSESGTDVIAPTRPSENSRLVEALGREFAAIGGEKTARELLRATAG